MQRVFSIFVSRICKVHTLSAGDRTSVLPFFASQACISAQRRRHRRQEGNKPFRFVPISLSTDLGVASAAAQNRTIKWKTMSGSEIRPETGFKERGYDMIHVHSVKKKP